MVMVILVRRIISSRIKNCDKVEKLLKYGFVFDLFFFVLVVNRFKNMCMCVCVLS